MADAIRTPRDLAQFLLDARITGELITDIGDTPTVPAAAEALGVSPEQIIKTLLFWVEKEGERQAIVVISNGVSRVDKRSLAAHFGVGRKRIKLAKPDEVLELLGYPAGGVPPWGHRTECPVILDDAVADAAARFGGVLYGGGGDDRTMLRMTFDELLRVTRPDMLAVSE
ncbi:MAG: YbaK/EbsC family protein [Caldilineaceae bacterium]|nr:YbaK/EbsC family protein [Caldilineaceae bacterium]